MRRSRPATAANPPHAGPEVREPPAAPQPRKPWRERAAVRALAAAVIFVLGVAIGGVVVGFATNGSKPPLPRRTVTATKAAPAPAARAGARSPVVGAAGVNGACLRALNDSQTAYSGLGRLAAALRAFDATRIDHALLDLQSRQRQLRQDLGTCHISGRVATATPPASPSSS